MNTRNQILHLLSLAVLIILPLLAAAQDAESATPAPPRVIFDTDMGSDCDDAGALAVLHALADAGEVRILGVIFSSGRNQYGVGTCDAINTYYGRGDLPLGRYQDTDVGDPKDSYTKKIASDTERFGHDVIDSAPDLLTVYRSILESQPDQSVTICTVGHPHALVHLLRDPRGAALVRAKVDRWIAMGMGGWNFEQMGMAAYCQELLEQSSWDQVAVLFIARPELFTVEHVGRVERMANGRIVWNADVNHPNHWLVQPRLTTDEMAGIIEELMARPPEVRAP